MVDTRVLWPGERFRRDPARPGTSGDFGGLTRVPRWITGLLLVLGLGFLDGHQQRAAGTLELSVAGAASLDDAHHIGANGLWEADPLRIQQRRTATGESETLAHPWPTLAGLTLLDLDHPGAVRGRAREAQGTLVDLSVAVHPDRIHAPPLLG